VAATFVPPECYSNLMMRRHTLIVGPRGSGKTTLLKMLQGPALEAWKHPDAQQYRDRIDFTGIFVPADRSWTAQLSLLGQGRIEHEHAERLGIAAFTTHVLRSLVSAIEYRIRPPNDPTLVAHRRKRLSREGEKEFVDEVTKVWFLEPHAPSLLGLRHALSARLSSILELSSSESTRGPGGRSERLGSTTYLHLDFLAAAGFATEVFNSLADDDGGKWAFLFDELELAPDWIRAELIRSLRSDNRFLFKLSLSPYTSEKTLSPSGAWEGHDYEIIPLWYPQKEKGYDFCRALIVSMLKERGIVSITPENLLGSSEFDASDGSEEGSRYLPGSRIQRRFVNLARKDASFATYLRDHNLDVRRFQQLKDNQRAAEVRKISALVVVRDTFRRGDEDASPAKPRSRKNPNLYRGATAVFAIVEGNPRWLIGVVAPLLKRLEGEVRAETTHLVVRPSLQAKEVSKAGNRFRAFLKTIPCPALGDSGAVSGVLQVLDAIGEYFYSQIVLSPFNPDPPGTFVVDGAIPDGVMKSLAIALNAGAVVYVPDPRSELVLDSLTGKRFRLSYLLAPHYKLPIQLGRAISLSTILLEHGVNAQTRLFLGEL
jgi:hypothetical protein